MANSEKETSAVPFQRHPLYEKAMQQMAGGEEAEALATLERLAQLYPDQKAVQDLLLRMQLRTTFSTTDYIPVEHTQPTPVLRSIVVVLLLITGCLVVVTASSYVNTNIIAPTATAEAWNATINAKVADLNLRMQKLDWSGARDVATELASLLPNDPSIAEAIQNIDQQVVWSELYTSALTARERGEYREALDLLDQIPPEASVYPAAQRVSGEVEELLAQEEAWAEAQRLWEAQDWQGVISRLEGIRVKSPEFRRREVEDRLYQAYELIIGQLLNEADGRVEVLREAIAYMDRALKIRPTNRDLIEERDLATKFVAGSEAYGRGDWAAAVESWEPVYAARPDYQGGVLRQRLSGAYPRAATQLIDQAQGSERDLVRAIDYLDQALISDPGNEDLREERRLVVEYLAGRDVFGMEKWDLAIARWGPIYLIRPNYQSGVLEQNLRAACINSESPDATLCPP
jgi:tetratricopeptide (TPR) repeat protein